jgi:hypothetical protein
VISEGAETHSCVCAPSEITLVCFFIVFLSLTPSGHGPNNFRSAIAQHLYELANSYHICSVTISGHILYIQSLPQHSSDSAVTGPVEIGPIPMRATASTGGSKPHLYCHRSTQYIVHLCRRCHSCQRDTNTIALLCLLCSFSTRYHSHVSWG